MFKNTILSIAILSASQFAHAGNYETQGIYTGITTETNSDYNTAGVHVSGIATNYNDAMFLAMADVVQRLQKGDGDRSRNATVGVAIGAGWLLGKEKTFGIGTIARYDHDSLLTDKEKADGKDHFNRQGIKPGVYMFKYFEKSESFPAQIYRVTVVNDGSGNEASFQVELKLD
jgi:hypothetical protein